MSLSVVNGRAVATGPTHRKEPDDRENGSDGSDDNQDDTYRVNVETMRNHSRTLTPST
jgi:hypothetical protein